MLSVGRVMGSCRCPTKRCTTGELGVKFYMGELKIGTVAQGHLRQFEKLLQRGCEGKINAYDSIEGGIPCNPST